MQLAKSRVLYRCKAHISKLSVTDVEHKVQENFVATVILEVLPLSMS